MNDSRAFPYINVYVENTNAPDFSPLHQHGIFDEEDLLFVGYHDAPDGNYTEYAVMRYFATSASKAAEYDEQPLAYLENCVHDANHTLEVKLPWKQAIISTLISLAVAWLACHLTHYVWWFPIGYAAYTLSTIVCYWAFDMDNLDNHLEHSA